MAIASFEEAAERTWAHVVERAQEELSESSFSMWFGGVRPRSLHDGILEIVAPSDYVRERLAKHYAGLIQDAAAEAVGLPVKLELDSAPPGDWIYEIKFDGFRALALRDARGTRLLSRNNKDFAQKFPEIVDAVAALDVADVILDGEIVALDEKRLMSVAAKEVADFLVAHPPEPRRIGDLVAVEVQDRQHRAVTRGI